MRRGESPLEAVLAQIERAGDSLAVETLVSQLGKPERALPARALLDIAIRLAGPDADSAQVMRDLLQEARRRGWPSPVAALAPPFAEGSAVWLKPEKADVQHGQVWTVQTTSGAVVGLAQLDGYDTEGGRRVWRAVNLETRRLVRVRSVLADSCPRIGGRRERSRR